MRVFFSGVGGVGIGPLALIALDMGYDVIGSDAQDSRYTQAMELRGIETLIPQSAENVEQAHEEKPLDWFVYTAALPNDHPELTAARSLGIRISKRDEFLNELVSSKGLRLIAASGTHGKTTTTGMLVWLLKELGQPVSYSIGTNISFGPSGQYDEASRYFVYEADEYDRNMLKFYPFAAVISSIDYDHPDTYPQESDYLDAFRQFASRSHCVFIWRQDAEKIGGLPEGAVHTYGVEEDLSFITLPGHNQRNAYLAIQCVHSLFPEKKLGELAEIINRFPGTERRFEKLADNLYTDYAHHPVEITSTIEMARKQNKKVVVVYQPHQNLRQHQLVKTGGYKSAFDGAKRVYWLPTYLSREPKDLEIIRPTELIKGLDKPQKAEEAQLDEKLKESIKRRLIDGNLVLIMGAGDVDYWARENLTK